MQVSLFPGRVWITRCKQVCFIGRMRFGMIQEKFQTTYSTSYAKFYINNVKLLNARSRQRPLQLPIALTPRNQRTHSSILASLLLHLPFLKPKRHLSSRRLRSDIDSRNHADVIEGQSEASQSDRGQPFSSSFESPR